MKILNQKVIYIYIYIEREREREKERELLLAVGKESSMNYLF